MEDKDIRLRRLLDKIDDYKLLEKWYQVEDVYLQFEQRILTFDEIKNKYYLRTKMDARVPVYMIEYKKIPIGIIQYKLINDEDKVLYCIKDNAYEIDIFIGEREYQNKGIGKESIKILKRMLFDKEIKTLVMIPLYNNDRAIACYKKCGFKEVRKLIMKDTIGKEHEYVLMVCYG